MIKIRGNELYHLRKAYINLFGEQKLKDLVEMLPEDSKKCFRDIIVSGDMYSLKYYCDFISAVNDKDGIEELKKVIINLADQQLRGFFGFLMKIPSPERIIKQSQPMWNKVYDSGRISKAEMIGNKVFIRVENFKTTKLHTFVIQIYFKTWIEKIISKKVEAKRNIINEETFELEFKYD